MLIHNDNDKKSFFVEFYLCIESFQKDQSIVDTSFLRQAQAPYKTLISTYTPPNLDEHNQNKENQIHLPIVLINVPVKNDYFEYVSFHTLQYTHLVLHNVAELD